MRTGRLGRSFDGRFAQPEPRQLEERALGRLAEAFLNARQADDFSRRWGQALAADA